jgi:hypothetical protein
MIQRGEARKADRVDAGPIAQQVHVVVTVVFRGRHPQRVARPRQPGERPVVEPPGAAARGVDRPPAPAIDHELDVTAEHALARAGWIGAQPFVGQAAGRDERQRVVVQHRPQDDRPRAAAVGPAQRATRKEQPPLVGCEGGDLLVGLPAALLPGPLARRAGSSGRLNAKRLCQDPSEPHLDRRCQQKAGTSQIGARPDGVRRPGGDRPRPRRDPSPGSRST